MNVFAMERTIQAFKSRKPLNKHDLFLFLGQINGIPDGWVRYMIRQLIGIAYRELVSKGAFTVPNLCNMKIRTLPAARGRGAGKKEVVGKVQKVKAKPLRRKLVVKPHVCLKNQALL